MLLGVDIGGTKVLIGVFDANGKVIETVRFETPKNYQQMIDELGRQVQNLSQYKFSAAAVAVPGRLDRKNGIAISFGNLPWKNLSILEDITGKIGCKTYIENDANLAGLAEYHALKNPEKRILYLTISTGIGSGIVVDGQLDPAMIDSEAGSILLPKDGELRSWEKFASGKAIFERYGKIARDINDPKIWQAITDDLALGIVDLCAVIEPDRVIIGGGVGSHYEKFDKQLIAAVKKLLPPMVKLPIFSKAIHAEEAALNGCYQLLKQNNEVK